MSLPTPKEVLKRVAEAQDALVELALKPAKDIAAMLGLPEPPEPPKASELVDALPDLPTPEAFIPFELPKLKKEAKEKVVEQVPTGIGKIKKPRVEEEEVKLLVA